MGFWPPDASRARTFTFFIKKATRVRKFWKNLSNLKYFQLIQDKFNEWINFHYATELYLELACRYRIDSDQNIANSFASESNLSFFSTFFLVRIMLKKIEIWDVLDKSRIKDFSQNRISGRECSFFVIRAWLLKPGSTYIHILNIWYQKNSYHECFEGQSDLKFNIKWI